MSCQLRDIVAEMKNAKVKATKIELHRAEGPAEMCYRITIERGNVWWQANQILQLWAGSVSGCYDKTDFTVTYADGETYEGRYDLHCDENADIAQHMQDHIDFYAGLRRPDHLTPEKYSEYLQGFTTEESRQECKDFLAQYEIGC